MNQKCLKISILPFSKFCWETFLYHRSHLLRKLRRTLRTYSRNILGCKWIEGHDSDCNLLDSDCTLYESSNRKLYLGESPSLWLRGMWAHQRPGSRQGQLFEWDTPCLPGQCCSGKGHPTRTLCQRRAFLGRKTWKSRFLAIFYINIFIFWNPQIRTSRVSCFDTDNIKYQMKRRKMFLEKIT